jgi:hypothetical protein
MTRTGKGVLIVLFVAGMACAASAQIGLGTGVFATGGGLMSNGTYAAAGTIGQDVIGRSTGATYVSAAGFWGGGGVILDVKGSTVSGTPMVYTLDQNYPNPFNPSTTIKFELPRASHVSLTVFDVLGREVSELVNERKEAGVYEVKFDGSNLASGVYFYRLQAGDFVQSKRLLLLK